MRMAALPLLALALLASGCAAGADTTAQPEVVTETVTMDSEVVTETVMAEPEPAETVTETVTETVEVTPQSCLEALDLAVEGFDLSSRNFQISTDAIQAILDTDYDRFEGLMEDMGDTTEEMNDLAPLVGPVSADCRAKAE